MAKIKIDKEKCKGCQLCINACPEGLIDFSGPFNSFGLKVVKFKDGKKCKGCMLCAIVCPDCAIEVFK